MLLLSALESVFEGVNEGGGRAAPTRSVRSMRPNPKEAAAGSPSPRCFGSARRSRRRPGVRSINGMSMVRGSFGESRERRRHGSDPRPSACGVPTANRLWPSRRLHFCSGGGRRFRSTACSRARARCSGGCGARREGPRGRSSHLALRRAGRGARREALPIPSA